jgi:hypothetical protein
VCTNYCMHLISASSLFLGRRIQEEALWRPRKKASVLITILTEDGGWSKDGTACMLLHSKDFRTAGWFGIATRNASISLSHNSMSWAGCPVSKPRSFWYSSDCTWLGLSSPYAVLG